MTAPWPPGPPSASEPVPDPRARDLAPDFAGLQALVAGLVLPDGASMQVMSALETSRELIRYAYYRYEFATVAVTHALTALEAVLAERLAADDPLEALMARAVETGLLGAGTAGELDAGRRLRVRLARGAVTSGELPPLRAVTLVRAVFDAVAVILAPDGADGADVAADAEEAAADGTRPADPLARAWAGHLRAPFPAGFRGADIEGVDFVLLDADVAGLVQRELAGGLDDDGIARLWACVADLDTIVPLINEQYCASYFARLRVIAGLAAARHSPAAV